MAQIGSPVSPIELRSLPATPVSTSPAQARTATSSTNTQKASWLPFTLQWYYLVIPTVISLCLGSVLVYLSIYSKQNQGIGADNGSSAILFGWRFTPTLIAVLYAQMTVILFEDVKRTEPFARLAKAPPGGASAYGTLLQTPRAWWSIFIDLCYRRKRIGQTSWSLIWAALINLVALLAISPLSSALLTSEEVVIPRTVAFTRIVPKANTQIPMVPTRDTYYRTMNAALRNVTTSAWVTNTSSTFPFWPSSEPAQFGPNLASSYGTWKMNTTTFRSTFECQEMTLKSAEITNKQYSGVYSQQGRGPLNGTQPMVTYVLESGDECKYELSVHPAIDIAGYGGMTWSDASTFYPTAESILPIGGQVFTANMTSTDIWSRVNASRQCNGRDIIIMSTPYTAPIKSLSQSPFLPRNATYERSSAFRMRGLLCDSQYHMSEHSIKATMSGASRSILDTDLDSQAVYQKVPESLINIPQFHAKSTQNEWGTYFDSGSWRAESNGAIGSSTVKFPGFSGMAPLLAASSRFNLTSMLNDQTIAQQAAQLKGRFFSELLRETFTNPLLVENEVAEAVGTVVENRVVVLTEIGIALAALFYASSLLLIAVFWNSRMSRRPLHLRSDPASTVGLSLLFNQRLAQSSIIKHMHDKSRVDFYTALQGERFLTTDNELLKGDDNTDPPIKVKPKRTWKPGVIHVRWLLSLGFLLTLVLVAILVLNAYSARSQLSQLAFIYEADVSRLGLTFSTFAPISIAPTVISIAVGLWWDQLDSTFRVLQPFISMSRGPTPICDGAGLTYRSKSWVGAVIKAGRKKHWVLFMVSMGSVLAQVLTVSMSALFEREARNVIKVITVPRNLEIRQVPIITEVNVESDASDDDDPAAKVLDSLYLDTSKNWLYGAGIQHSYNGSRLPWTAEGWSFLPLDLSNILDDQTTRSASNPGANDASLSSANVTVNTPAIRARLQCSVIHETLNESSWIDSVHLDNEDELYLPADFAQIENTTKVRSYSLQTQMFAGTDSHTTGFARSKPIECCSNGTRSNPQRAVIGYWSPIYPPNSSLSKYENNYPYTALSWPVSISTKWIVGNPFNLTYGTSTKHMFFPEMPQIQAARCEPIIETAEAVVTLDPNTGNVLSYSTNGPANTTDVAWVDVFTKHEPNPKTRSNASSLEPLNITTSYGVLFLDSLLGSVDRVTGGEEELLNKNAFSFRDQGNGIAMDLMTYSMFTLADKTPEALLNFTTLAAYADRTFQTFFQHFVNNGLSLTKGGYAYQPINDTSLEAIGRPMNDNGTVIQGKSFPVLDTSRSVTATVSHRIRVLHMNTTATYLSTAILIWLIFTTLIVVCLQRRYTSFMNRDVQLIADMLILVAGSDNFLSLVAQEGVSLKTSRDVKTMLGWFRDRDGHIRWGVEVVGGRNAVDWVDAPKQGFHIPDAKAPRSLSWWRVWRT